LTVIAVHAAEFPLSKDRRWACEEIARLGLRYPIALDPAFRRIAGSNNRYWPATHLVDREGFVRFRQYGPGGFVTIEGQIRSLLSREAESGPAPAVEGTPDESWVSSEASPELYGTFYIGARGELGGTLGSASDFAVPPEIEPHRLYAGGRWVRRDDGLELDHGAGRCAVRYRAREVFLLASPGTHAATVRVTLDGGDVPAFDAGIDLDANSCVRVERPCLLSLIRHPAMQTHRLDLETDDPGVIIHRISFLPYQGDTES
jgi:hypothetical protein